MINEKYTDGKDKPAGLYEWQQKYNVQDEDPLFGFGAIIYSLLARLYGFVADMSAERKAMAEQHEKQIDALKKAHDSIERTVCKLGDFITRSERLMFHLSVIEQHLPGLAHDVAGKLDYDKISKLLNERITEICEEIPLDQVAKQIITLDNAGNRIELAANKMTSAAQTMESYKDSKLFYATTVAGGLFATISLVLALGTLASLPHYFSETPAQATNAISTFMPSQGTQKLDGVVFIPKGQPVHFGNKTFIEIEPAQ